MTEPTDTPADQPETPPARGSARHAPPPKGARVGPQVEGWHDAMDDPKALGARLHALRLAAGMSAAEVGRAAGRSGPYLRQVERGKRRPSPGTVRAVLGVTLAGADERREQALEDLIRLGTITGQLADERPERRKRRRQAAAAARETIRRAAAAGTGEVTAAELQVMLTPDPVLEEMYEAVLGSLGDSAEPDPVRLAEVEASIVELTRLAGWTAPDPASLLDREIDEALADTDRMIAELVAEHPPGALVDELLEGWQSARQAEDRPPDRG